MDQVVVSGVASPFLQAGDPAASEAVIFVHGNPGPATDWADLLDTTGGFARAIALDFPGFGRADAPDDFDYSIAGYAQHLQNALQLLGVARAHLVAHDFGGPWALAWTVRNPAAFASATLINTGVLLDYHWHRYARIWRTPVFGELAMAGTSRLTAKALMALENPGLRGAGLDAVARAMTPRRTRQAILRLYRATPASAMTGPVAALAALDRPALVVWGEDDRYLPVAHAQRQRRAFPSARVHTLPGVGHWAMHECPGRLRELVLPFLRQQVNRR
jgi:pimeloyl-ACP methyl ester carboxylesterase